MKNKLILIPVLALLTMSFSRHDKEFKVYQFPQNQTPRIDGDFSDWDIVPDSFIVGTNELVNTVFGVGIDQDPKDFDLNVKVAWVKDLNRLYFYVDAYDDYWDFIDPVMRQDIFEVVIDGDVSGGPFIDDKNGNINKMTKNELYFKGHGGHAQNYHVFTPVKDKDWAMIWGATPWLKEFPYAQVAYKYNFKSGESGRLQMEFYITPCDYASHEGFDKSVVSQLQENELIGLSWSMLDFDGKQCESFMNLSHDIRMISDASYLCAFRLMPLAPSYKNTLAADWRWVEEDRSQRIFRFYDKSDGEVQKWHWDFGDGKFSEEQNPVHKYSKGGEWTVILTVEGKEGKSVRSKVWDVVTK
jgi:hypothetical protein